MRLSKSSYSPFVGEVFALYLLPDEYKDFSDINKTGGVTWTTEGDIFIQHVCTADSFGSEAGVILLMKKAGTALVRARYKGKEYTCTINARERKRYDGSSPLSFYRGDLHDHTSMIHSREPFAVRISEYPIDMINTVKSDGGLDFTVISDHGDVLCKKDFLRGFVDAELALPCSTVIFPGSESEANVYERDRFGSYHKHSGEVVMFNSPAYSAAYSWEEFVNDHRHAPLAIGIFAHPQVVGYGGIGLWNNQYKRNKDSGLKRFMRLVEMGNGEDRAENLIHEYSYSDALDAGFRVTVSCSSDSHGPVWGSYACTGKTVIVAPEKSKEAFLDALNDLRAYATESGNVKLSYAVNGKTAPADLDLTDSYSFKVNIDYFEEKRESEIVKCSVISDYGESLLTLDAEGKESLEFDVSSASARYFYLRLVDRMGKKTWSMPVFTGRDYDKEEMKELTPIPEADYDVFGADGVALDVLKNRDLFDSVRFNTATPELTIVLREERAISAVGITHLKINNVVIKDRGERIPDYLSEFVSKYRISVSTDNVKYTDVKEGRILVFGDEVILDFDPINAKYVKLCVLSTVGGESDCPKYKDAPARISEISLFS